MDNPLSSREEIIHRIQSFLDGKAATQTSTLSKLWYRAWRTRPDLDFRRDHFGSDERLLEFATKTVERYEQLNHKIDSFNLHMPREVCSRRNTSLVNELMVRAMKLGAVDLAITLWVWIIDGPDHRFTLPHCVLRFETLTRLSLAGNFKLPVSEIRSETLASLSLTGNFGIGLKDLTCPKLKTLSLSVAAAADADFLRILFSRFPELESVKLDDGTWTYGEAERRSTFYLGWNRSKSRSPFPDGGCEYHKLKYMHLEHLDVEVRLFSPSLFSSKFPFLKELVIWDCKSLQNIQIRSESLELISIGFCQRERERTCYLVLEVPNIRKFRFEGSPFSRLDFKTTTTTTITTTTSREFESDIHATCDDPSFEWFISLNTFLIKLSLISKVCLSITNPRGKRWNREFNPVAVGSRRPHAVEYLRIGVEGEVRTAFLDSLILTCRPKFLVHEDRKEHDYIKDHLLELASKRKLVEEVNAERVLEDKLPWNYSCTRRLVQWGMVYKHRN